MLYITNVWGVIAVRKLEVVGPNTSIGQIFKMFQTRENILIFNTSSISEMESWLAYSDKSAIDIDISRYSNSSFWKTTALNSVKVWIDGFLLLEFFPQCPRHGFW